MYTLKYANQASGLMKALLFFYKQLAPVNIALSCSFASLGLLAGQAGFSGFVNIFLISYLLFGYLLAILYFHLRYKAQYYFYFNLGYTKAALYLFGFAVNLLLVTAVWLLKSEVFNY